jgi:prepilin-type N-terminal cleavage/methylation domain-containing protein
MTARRAAFTLLEVMLAVTMLGLLVLAVSSTWSAGLRGWKRSNGLAETYQRQRVVLDALTELAQAAIYVPERARLYAVRAERDPFLGDSISFVTSSDALLPPHESLIGGMRRVTIGITRDDNGQPCLTMLNVPALQEVDKFRRPAGHVLGRDVIGFAVRYRDAQTGIWKDTWTEADHFPSALEFAITFAGPEPLVVVRTVDLPTAKLIRQQR